MDDKSEYARQILENPLYKEVLEDLRTSLTVDFLSTNPDEGDSREHLYSKWLGAQEFFGMLQSYIDNADIERAKEDELKEKRLKAEEREKAKQDALKDL